ncbi:hypothetical protein GCM10009850_120950 [Nonomuraea monospora]|uniref:Peptidase S9 prolyl oligopeptidase catalytic domain-containing protein n=1 Tax=Nonomuraea monospora TaxID=568818 RepID=A0ABN3D4L8_9ACTN
MAVPSELPPHVAAQHRAMPLSRLLDYGMARADARALLADTAAGTPWAESAERLATARWDLARRAEDRGAVAVARQELRAAAAALMFAQMAHQTDTPEKRRLYAGHLDAVAELARLAGPFMERIEPEYRNGRLLGWLCLPESGRADITIIVCGGLTGWGAAFLSSAEALVARGLACLLVEGPGQGWPRLAHGLYLDGSVAAGLSRFVDVVRGDPRLGETVGVQGNSFGGLFAALLAAEDPRVRACVVNGAPAVPVLPEFRTAREQIFAALGHTDAGAAAATLAELRLDPVKRPIGRPVLVLHGGADRLVTRELQEPFVAAGDPAASSLRLWPDGEHTMYNHAAERDALTADWFAEQLGKALGGAESGPSEGRAS